MSENKYWVLLLKGEEPKTFTSWPECKEAIDRNPSRNICHGFPTEEEAEEFKNGRWRGKSFSREAEAWLEKYKARPGQLTPDTDLDTSKLSCEEYPRYCAYVDGSYNPKSKIYGFGVVFICDGNIEKFYGSGKEENLVKTNNGAGELLACMEAIKYAETMGLPELTIIYDSELIQWAYLGCGSDMLTQAAGRYIDDIRKKMRIEVMSIQGRAHKAGENSVNALADKHANALADKLAKKGAGIVD